MEEATVGGRGASKKTLRRTSLAATHSSILAWRIPMVTGAYSPQGCKGSDTTEETEHTAPGVKNPPANPEDTSLILGPGRFNMPQSN